MITPDAIPALLTKGESVTLAFKASFDLETIETMVASRTRNKLIAEAFYLTNNIEKYGSGIIRIRKELKEYPEVDFVVEEVGGGVLVTFRQIGGINEGINEGIKSLFAYIKEHLGTNIPEMSKVLGTPPKTLERWLKQLKDSQKIIHRGSRKTGGYYSLEEGE